GLIMDSMLPRHNSQAARSSHNKSMTNTKPCGTTLKTIFSLIVIKFTVMRIILYFSILMMLFTQCKSSQSIFKKKADVPFSVKDLNILVAAAYVKHHQKDCNDT